MDGVGGRSGGAIVNARILRGQLINVVTRNEQRGQSPLRSQTARRCLSPECSMFDSARRCGIHPQPHAAPLAGLGPLSAVRRRRRDIWQHRWRERSGQQLVEGLVLHHDQ